jgi:3-dehydroquinate synthase
MPTHDIPVSLGSRSYNVHVEAGSLTQASALLAPYLAAKPPLIICDENVARTQLPVLQSALPHAPVIILPPGEQSKSWNSLEQLTERLLALNVERGDTLLAFGGGVIGDLVGFAAAILKRGCRFIQIPTSLLAMVDSSVGGKTAINTMAGKNLIGAFYQPDYVLIDPHVLHSLPVRELRAGYAEIVKYGLINDVHFFHWCADNVHRILAQDDEALSHAIRTSVQAKAGIVSADEQETQDMRALLNLGHTFGHALEAEAGFSDALLHGEAVAAGIALAFQFSAKRGLCSVEDAQQVRAHLQVVGLPYSLSSAGINASGKALVAHMLHDKKMRAGTLPFILTQGIGKAYVDSSVSLADVEHFLEEQA